MEGRCRQARRGLGHHSHRRVRSIGKSPLGGLDSRTGAWPAADLIVESDSVADLTDGAESKDATRRLIDLLDGEEVLAYETGSRAALRQFAKALRSRCETTVAAQQNA
jgi:hypothetical protein